MKQLIALCLLLSPSLLTSQILVENIINSTEEYNPLFGKETATLNFDFFRITDMDEADTNYSFVISISNTALEAKGYSSSVGIAFSGGQSGWGVGSNKMYSIERQTEDISMNLDTLKLMLEYANDLYVHAQEQHEYSNIAIRQIKNLRLAVEQKANSKGTTYFLSMGEAVYTLDESQFVSLIRSAQKARDFWIRGH